MSDEVSLTLSTRNIQTLFEDEGGGMVVRRLTPRECERLQGFPDDWTKIPYRGKPAEECPDGPRYKAIGNSMAVPVMRWIGRRIGEADAENVCRAVKSSDACDAGGAYIGGYTCSACGAEIWADRDSITPFCPMCGSKVGKVDE